MRKLQLLSAILVLCLLMTACQPHKLREDNDAASSVTELTFQDNVTSGCSAEEYSMDITLDTESNVLSGTSVAKLINKTDAPLEELCFRLYSASISSGFINGASNADTGNAYAVRAEKDESVIYVSLGEDAIQPGQTLSVKLDFESTIPEIDDRLGHSVNANGKLYNMTFCFPQIAFLENGEWFEQRYCDSGESYYYEMTDYYVTLNAPSDYVVLSTGKSETMDGKTVIQAPNVREMAICACNFGQIKSIESNGVTYNILAADYPGMDAQYLTEFYDTILTVAVESAELYTQRIGKYIYDELDIIPMGFESFGGMEMPGLVQIIMPTMDNEGCYLSAVATAHEVGHQWFYCAVGNDTSSEPWLDESFTSYLEYLYWDEFETGKAAVEKFDDQYLSDFEVMDPAIRFGDTSCYESEGYINLSVFDYGGYDYGQLVYENGAWFLRSLELTMGSDTFFEMMSHWYEDNINQIVTGREFITHVLSWDSSQAVKDVINAYISAEAL